MASELKSIKEENRLILDKIEEMSNFLFIAEK